VAGVTFVRLVSETGGGVGFAPETTLFVTSTQVRDRHGQVAVPDQLEESGVRAIARRMARHRRQGPGAVWPPSHSVRSGQRNRLSDVVRDMSTLVLRHPHAPAGARMEVPGVVSRMFIGLVRVRVTAAYAAVLVAVAGTLSMLGPQVQRSVIAQMSTNLYNLQRGHLGTLVGSAFVTDDGQIYIWLPGLVCLLALAELFWRGRRLVMAFALGHVGATLIVAVWLAVATHVGWLPKSVALASDVGMSYGAAGVLGALTAAIPSGLRPAWIGWWLAVGLLIAAPGQDFTAIGHALALTLGVLLATRLPAATRWTPTQLVLLAVSVVFGYLMLAGSSPMTAPIVGVAGALIALTGQWIARRWGRRRIHEPIAVRIQPPTITTQAPTMAAA
jgi:hypothetical protein